jgi:hypothetical protein
LRFTVLLLWSFFSILLLILSPFHCSGDEEETPAIDTTARTSTSRTLVVSEVQVEGEESSPTKHRTAYSSCKPPCPFTKKGKDWINHGACLTIGWLHDSSFGWCKSLLFFFVLSIFRCYRLFSLFASFLLCAVELFSMLTLSFLYLSSLAFD